MVIQEPELLLPVPEGVPMDCAATAMCGGLTTHNSLQNVRPSVDEAIEFRGRPAMDLNPSIVISLLNDITITAISAQYLHGLAIASTYDAVPLLSKPIPPIMADTCLVLFFFLELATRCDYNSMLTFETFLYISNAFQTFETCFEYLQRVLNLSKRILNICNVFETFKTAF